MDAKNIFLFFKSRKGVCIRMNFSRENRKRTSQSNEGMAETKRFRETVTQFQVGEHVHVCVRDRQALNRSGFFDSASNGVWVKGIVGLVTASCIQVSLGDSTKISVHLNDIKN